MLAVALLFALLAAACDGGDEGEPTEARETPAAGETPAEDETPPADGGGDEGGAGLQELETLAEEAVEGATGKVVYRVTTALEGESVEQEWVIAQRPPDTRFEIAVTEAGEESRSIFINTGGKSYICTSGGGEESCLGTTTEQVEAGEEAFSFFFDTPQELAEEVEDVDLVDKSERQIAGVDATCFTVRSGLLTLAEGEICFSEEGLLLFLRGEAEGEGFTVEATSVSTDVTDADFEPPYEVIELPEFELPES